MPARVRRLVHILALFVLLLSTFSASFVPASAAPPASQSSRITFHASEPKAPDGSFKPPQAINASYTIGFVNVYKYPTGQPLCTGVAIVNQYFGGEECGFAVFTLSPADDNKVVDVNFRDQDGNIFHTEQATYDSVDDEYSAEITPESDWPAGPITLEAVMHTPDAGSASTGFFLNDLHLIGEVNQASYTPSQAVVVSGTVSRRTGPGNAPIDVPVDADLTAQLLNPDDDTVINTQTTTAALISGNWTVTFPGGATGSLVTGDYRVVVTAEWTDPSAANGPEDWAGALNLIAPFDTGEGDLVFSATQTATDGVVRPGQTYLTVLRVENPTADAATGITVTAVLPAGAVFVSAVPSPTGGAGTGGNPYYWTFSNLASDAETAVYVYARAKNFGEDNTIVWQLLDLEAGLSYTHDAQAKTAGATTLGPKVAPEGEVGDTVRHGQRPFPVALVDYVDIKHDAANTGSYFKNEIFPVLIERYQEMSFGQLLPVPVLPSVGVGDVRYDETPGATYRWSELDPAGFCSGATLATGDDPPAGATYRIQDEWYQLPGTQGYYGSDSTGNNYLGALTNQPALVNVDNGCGPTGKLVYDAATLMDPDIDYNDFDSDRDGWVDFFELVYAGQPQNIIGETGANNVWPHSSSLEYYFPEGYLSHDQLRNHQDELLYWTNADQTDMTTSVTAFPVYVKVGPYNVNAEFSDEVTFSHEYGHSLGLPDNYTLGTRETMNDWDLMSSGEGHMSLWDKQELGWVVPTVLTSSLDVPAQTELKIDTETIRWLDDEGQPYTLTGVHNADVYKVDLPKVELFDPAIIPSGSWVYYSQAGNDYGYPGHIFDIAFDANLTAGASALQLRFRSWYEIEKDYDYGYVQVSTDGGATWTNLASGQGTTGSTNPNGNNHGNGITCVSGAQTDPLCGTVSYPEPAFITDTFDLSPYAGEDFILRWAYSTDPGLAMRGWVIDDIALVADGDEIFFDDAEDPVVSNDDTHVYNGWLRSNGSGTAEHAYWIGVRDRTGFDEPTSFQPGVVIEYANEAHGYGNVGVDDPPALTVLDSQPTPGSDTPGLDDAAWRPFALDPGSRLSSNRDLFTDCGNGDYADGPRHVENYTDPNGPDTQWLFAYQRLTMLVSALAGEGSGNMSASVNYQVPAVCGEKPGDAMLTISKTDAPDPVRAGRNLTYTLTVVNGGQSSANNVVVTDTVPADTTYVACDGAPCSQNGGIVSWQVGTLLPGGTASLHLVVTVSAGASNGAQITNSAYGVDSDDTAPASGAPVVTTVTTSAVPELLLSKTASSNLVGPGQRLTYTLSLVNGGQAGATLVVVTDEIPANTTYVSCGGAVCVLNGNTVQWTVGALAQGATATLTLVVDVDANTPGGVFIANSVYSADSAETNVVDGAPVLIWVGYLVRLPLVFR